MQKQQAKMIGPAGTTVAGNEGTIIFYIFDSFTSVSSFYRSTVAQERQNGHKCEANLFFPAHFGNFLYGKPQAYRGHVLSRR